MMGRRRIVGPTGDAIHDARAVSVAEDPRVLEMTAHLLDAANSAHLPRVVTYLGMARALGSCLAEDASAIDLPSWKEGHDDKVAIEIRQILESRVHTSPLTVYRAANLLMMLLEGLLSSTMADLEEAFEKAHLDPTVALLPDKGRGDTKR